MVYHIKVVCILILLALTASMSSTYLKKTFGYHYQINPVYYQKYWGNMEGSHVM
jgi:hypothetical protein